MRQEGFLSTKGTPHQIETRSSNCSAEFLGNALNLLFPLSLLLGIMHFCFERSHYSMVQVSLQCPFCRTERVTKNGISNSKQRYNCHNSECSHTTFYAEYRLQTTAGMERSAMTDLTERFRHCALLHSGCCWGKYQTCRRTGVFRTFDDAC